MILHCPNCKQHEFQDERYGRNKRVHNPTKNGDWRCTICGTVRTISGTIVTGTKMRK